MKRFLFLVLNSFFSFHSIAQNGQIIKQKFYDGKFNQQDTSAGYAEAVLVDNILYISGAISKGTIAEQLKGIYRTSTTKSGGDRGIESFEAAYNKSRSEGALFNMENLAASNVRINQGFIITNIMHTVPESVPYSNGGEMIQILEAASLPRIIAPDKLKERDRGGFKKYTGLALREDTSMSLSSLGDAYLNFGVIGGCIFMFVFGWMFNVVLNGFYKFSKKFPIILMFTPLVFYFPMRPDTALQTGLGHLVKACILLYIMIIFLNI